jgi:hypothetical protein
LAALFSFASSPLSSSGANSGKLIKIIYENWRKIAHCMKTFVNK